jgi:acetyl esterase/lipase
MRWFWQHYVAGAADNHNPLAVPLLGEVDDLPPLMVTAAEFDPLLDDSTRLVARLEAAGAPHRYVLWPGVTHACIHMTGCWTCPGPHHRHGGLGAGAARGLRAERDPALAGLGGTRQAEGWLLARSW